jgi:tRNA C32,U32 (ribose-2'-O)-methylase TrmJ
LEDNRKFKEENDELKEKMERILKDNDSINEHNEEVMAKLRKQIEKGNKQDCDKKIAKLKKELFNLLG